MTKTILAASISLAMQGSAAAAENNHVNEVIVTGFRASPQRVLDIKRVNPTLRYLPWKFVRAFATTGRGHLWNRGARIRIMCRLPAYPGSPATFAVDTQGAESRGGGRTSVEMAAGLS